MSEGVHTLVHYPERDQLLVVGSSCTLNVLTRDEQLGTWVTASKMKFATGTGEAATGLQVRGARVGGFRSLEGKSGARRRRPCIQVVVAAGSRVHGDPSERATPRWGWGMARCMKNGTD